MKLLPSMFIVVLFLSFISAGCTKSDVGEISIPEYPGATEDQEYKAKMLGMKGSVRRVITSDSFDKVFAFYKAELEYYDTEIMSHALEDGRQAAITIKENKKSSTTVAIQEFKKEGKVTISYMSVGF